MLVAGLLTGFPFIFVLCLPRSIIFLSNQKICIPNRSLCTLCTSIRANPLLASVFICNDKFIQGLKLRSIIATKSKNSITSFIPSVCKANLQTVFFLQCFCYIISLVFQNFIIWLKSWIQIRISYLFSINDGFIKSQLCNIQSCPFHTIF